MGATSIPQCVQIFSAISVRVQLLCGHIFRLPLVCRELKLRQSNHLRDNNKSVPQRFQIVSLLQIQTQQYICE